MNSSKPDKIVLIGSSTGGPGLLESILTSLKQSIDFTIVIIQHMDALSLSSFSKRLNRINPSEVIFVNKNMPIKKGKIYLLKDSSFLCQNQNGYHIELDTTKKSFYHPEVDRFFSSAAKLKGVEIITYLLSGIGADGAKGMLDLKNAGFKTVAQDEETSIVYGMPKSAYELGASTHVMSIEEIIRDIKNLGNKSVFDF